MSSDLKPCPFCGGEAVETYQPPEEGSHGSSYDVIRCIDCRAQVRPKHWNNRPQLDEAVSALEFFSDEERYWYDQTCCYVGDREEGVLSTSARKIAEETLSNLRGERDE